MADMVNIDARSHGGEGHTRTHTHTEGHTRTRTHAHARTHTHTHTPSSPPPLLYMLSVAPPHPSNINKRMSAPFAEETPACINFEKTPRPPYLNVGHRARRTGVRSVAKQTPPFAGGGVAFPSTLKYGCARRRGFRGTVIVRHVLNAKNCFQLFVSDCLFQSETTCLETDSALPSGPCLFCGVFIRVPAVVCA